MQYERHQRGIAWGVASAAVALALGVGLLPPALAFAGDSDDADENPVVTSEPTLDEAAPVATSEPTLDEKAVVGASLQAQDSTGAGQKTAKKDVYIDNTVDESVSYVTGVVEVNDAATHATTTVTVYSSSAPVTYGNPKPSAVDALIVEAIEATWKHADDNGYVYDIDQSMEPVQRGGKVWDNRKYETLEDGDAVLIGDSDYLQGAYGASTDGEYTRTHIASGDYGKETYFTVTLSATAGKAAPAATDDSAATGSPADAVDATAGNPADTTEPAAKEAAAPAATDEPAAAAKSAAEASHDATGLPATSDPMRALPGLLAAMALCGMAMLFAAIRLRPVRPRSNHARR